MPAGADLSLRAYRLVRIREALNRVQSSREKKTAILHECGNRAKKGKRGHRERKKAGELLQKEKVGKGH